MTKQSKKAPHVASDAALSLRLPTELLQRADALIPSLATEAVARGETRVSRSIVVKRAIEEGLAVLEGRYLRRGR